MKPSPRISRCQGHGGILHIIFLPTGYPWRDIQTAELQNTAVR